MSNKKILEVSAVVIALLVVAGLIYWQKERSSETQSLIKEEKTAQGINKALEGTTNAAGAVELPTTNPLNAAIPNVNPLEAANPFKGFKNPFD